MWDTCRVVYTFVILNNSIMSLRYRLYLSVGSFKAFNRPLYDFLDNSGINFVALFCTRCSLSTSIFTARCYASAVLAMALCLSVCPSVRQSQVGILLKRLNAGSHKQHHTIARGPVSYTHLTLPTILRV